jgi:hypothetical protein
MIKQVITRNQRDTGSQQRLSTSHPMLLNELFPSLAHEIQLSPQRSHESVVVDGLFNRVWIWHHKALLTTKSTGVAVRPETEIHVTSGNPVILSVLPT